MGVPAKEEEDPLDAQAHLGGGAGLGADMSLRGALRFGQKVHAPFRVFEVSLSGGSGLLLRAIRARVKYSGGPGWCGCAPNCAPRRSRIRRM